MATPPTINQATNPGGSNAADIDPPMPPAAWVNFVGGGASGAVPNLVDPATGLPISNIPQPPTQLAFLGGSNIGAIAPNAKPVKARPAPTPVPGIQQSLQAANDPGYNAYSTLNPFVQGGGISTMAYPPTGESTYGLMFQTNGEPLPLYPAPRPTEILPTRLIFPGALAPAQSRLIPVPGNAVIEQANRAWYNTIPKPDPLGVFGVAPVSGVGGPLVSEATALLPNDPLTAPGPNGAMPDLALKKFAPQYQPYVQWTIQNVMWLGVWVNISAYFEKAASIQLFGSVELGTDDALAYSTIEGTAGYLDREQNSPFPTQVDGGGWFGWMGCRSTWACTQQCWYIGLLCGLEKYGVAIVAVLLLLFELVLMEGIIVTDFIAVVPRTATWLDFFTADVPVTPRVATALVYLVFWLLLLGFCFHKLSEQSYFRQLGGGRILLRSLAANYEAQSYSYCNMIFWTILFEFDTVIIPAYFPFVLALLVMETYEGNIREAAVLLLIFYLVSRLHSMAIYIVELLACIPEWLIQPEDGADGFSASGPGANAYVRGSRVDVELNTLNYIYLWTTGIGFFLLLILMKLQMTMLYLWFVPAIIIWYCIAWQSIPYCLNGWPSCPTHTGPCVSLTAIATVIVFVSLFLFHHACFLFPCLCAPEVPGYLFFPPSGAIDSPLTGKFDVSHGLFLRRLFGGGDTWDCAWEPPSLDAAEEAEAAGRLLHESVALSPVLAFFSNALS